MAGLPEGHKPDEAGQIPQTPQEPSRAAGETTRQAAGQAPRQSEPTGEQAEQAVPQAPGFGERGRMRRRARFLRRARELAYRDLGGLVFDLHRFGQRNDQVVLAKLATLGHIDAELRALEGALREVRPVTVLREVGIAACPRCAAIHGSDDRFCPGCGLAFDRSADRPLSTAPVTATPNPAPAAAATPSPSAATAVSSPPAAASSPSPAGAAAATSPPSVAPADLSMGRPTTPIEPAPPVKPTATPVAARPSFSALSRPTPGQAPPAQESAPAHAGEDGEAPASTPSPTPSSPGLAQSPAEGNGEQKRGDEDEPTQILRPPARGA